MKKFLVLMLSGLSVFGAAQLSGPFTTSAQFNKTNSNLGPNGLNAVMNTLYASNFNAVVLGRELTNSLMDELNVANAPFNAPFNQAVDASVALQSAIDNATTNLTNNAVIYLPPGELVFSNSLVVTKPLTFNCSGPVTDFPFYGVKDGTILTYTGTNIAIIVTNTGVGINHGFKLSNVQLRTRNGSGLHGIAIYQTEEGALSNVRIGGTSTNGDGFRGSALYVNYNSIFKYDHCWAANCNNGITFDSTLAGNSQVQVSGWNFYNITNVCIRITQGVGADIGWNWFEKVKYGVELNSDLAGIVNELGIHFHNFHFNNGVVGAPLDSALFKLTSTTNVSVTAQNILIENGTVFQNSEATNVIKVVGAAGETPALPNLQVRNIYAAGNTGSFIWAANSGTFSPILIGNNIPTSTAYVEGTTAGSFKLQGYGASLIFGDDVANGSLLKFLSPLKGVNDSYILVGKAGGGDANGNLTIGRIDSTTLLANNLTFNFNGTFVKSSMYLDGFFHLAYAAPSGSVGRLFYGSSLGGVKTMLVQAEGGVQGSAITLDTAQLFTTGTENAQNFYGGSFISTNGITNMAATASRVAVYDSTKSIVSSSVSTNELNWLVGLTGGVQTNIDSKQHTFTTSTGITNIGNVLQLVPVAGTNIVLTTNASNGVVINNSYLSTNSVTIALSNPTLVVTTGSALNYWRSRYAGTIKEVTALLLVPSSSGSVTLDLKKNGTTILSAPVSLTAGTTNVTASVSVSALSAGDILTGDITAAGTTAKGAQLQIQYTTP